MTHILSTAELELFEELSGYSLKKVKAIVKETPNKYFRRIWNEWLESRWNNRCWCDIYWNVIDFDGEERFYYNENIPIPESYYDDYILEMRNCPCVENRKKCNCCDEASAIVSEDEENDFEERSSESSEEEDEGGEKRKECPYCNNKLPRSKKYFVDDEQTCRACFYHFS